MAKTKTILNDSFQKGSQLEKFTSRMSSGTFNIRRTLRVYQMKQASSHDEPKSKTWIEFKGGKNDISFRRRKKKVSVRKSSRLMESTARDRLRADQITPRELKMKKKIKKLQRIMGKQDNQIYLEKNALVICGPFSSCVCFFLIQ